jgi:DNA-binding CsgD family transcriptional regulator
LAFLSTFKKLRPVYAAFICFAATTLVFSPNTSIFRESAHTVFMGYFIFPMFVAALVVSCPVALTTRHRKPFEDRGSGFELLCACIYIGSSLSFAFFSLESDPDIPVVVAAGLLCGASLVPVCLRWACIFSELDYREAILYSALFCICSAAASMFLQVIPFFAKTIGYALFLAIGALTPFLASERTCSAKDGAPQKADETDRPYGEDPSALGLISTLKLPVISLLLYTFMMSINKFLAFDLFDSEYLGGCIAALCIIPLFAIRADKPLSSLIYRVIAPIIGAAVIILSSFPIDTGIHFIALFCVYIFLSALAILALAQIIAVMHAGEFSAAFIAATAIAFGSGISLAGLSWSHLFGGPSDYTPIVFVMISIYCAAMLVSLGWEAWRLLDSPIERQQSAIVPIDKTAGLELTKRETEILSYLGRGHSIVYIAEKLFISESTVRTHVKHIYAKLGIHSREELFALIDGSTR